MSHTQNNYPIQTLYQAKVTYCKHNNPSGPGPCPKCGAPTKLNKGINGNFWGCTGFPVCKGSRNWEEHNVQKNSAV